MIQPSSRDYQIKDVTTTISSSGALSNTNRKSSDKDAYKSSGISASGGATAYATDEDKKGLKKVN